MSNIETKKYHQTRFQYDKGRVKVWKAITEYLQPYVGLNKTVLDLGSGYGDFINLVSADSKLALDVSADVEGYLNDDVKFMNRKANSLKGVKSGSLDAVFSSNLLEHLSDDDLNQTLLEIKRCINEKGTLILIGPNFKYAYKEYFDDYTHKKIFTDISLKDTVSEYGFKAIKVMPKFLPLTLKSIMPKNYFLTKLYLASPFKPFGKQMLLIFEVEK